MAEKKSQKSKSSSTPKMSVGEFLNTITITPRNRFVVEKKYAKDNEKKTRTQWEKELKKNCKGVIFQIQK